MKINFNDYIGNNSVYEAVEYLIVREPREVFSEENRAWTLIKANGSTIIYDREDKVGLFNRLLRVIHYAFRVLFTSNFKTVWTRSAAKLENAPLKVRETAEKVEQVIDEMFDEITKAQEPPPDPHASLIEMVIKRNISLADEKNPDFINKIDQTFSKLFKSATAEAKKKLAVTELCKDCYPIDYALFAGNLENLEALLPYLEKPSGEKLILSVLEGMKITASFSGEPALCVKALLARFPDLKERARCLEHLKSTIIPNLESLKVTLKKNGKKDSKQERHVTWKDDSGNTFITTLTAVEFELNEAKKIAKLLKPPKPSLMERSKSLRNLVKKKP